MNNIFSIGDRLEITPVKSAFSYDKNEKRYASQLLDFDNVRTAKIAAPMQDGRLVPLRPDEDIEICFFTKAGLYQCRARVKDRHSDNNVPVLEVLIVTDPQKFQRRKFYRLECTFEIQYRRLSREELALREKLATSKRIGDEKAEAACEKEIEELPKEWRTATITNLSGGGVRFHLSEKLDVGESLEVIVPLSMKNGETSMQLMAHVIDCDKSEDLRSATSDARCEFDSIDNRQRERIVKYVFEEQRRRMSGGER